MNNLLNQYCLSVEFPDVSGAEHLEMLYIRNRLAELESTFTETEKSLLADADQKLIQQASEFFTQLSHFVDLPQRRSHEKISPQRWWWYLDVLAYLPQCSISREIQTITA
jgi:hypothetical protein